MGHAALCPASTVQKATTDRHRAAGLAALLSSMTPDEQRQAIAQEPRFQSRAVAEALIDRSLGTEGPLHPDRRLLFGRLALSVTRTLTAIEEPEALAHLTARAQGSLGDAHRLRGDLNRARGRVRRARAALAPAPDGRTEAWLGTLDAEVSKDLGLYPEAIQQLERAESLALHADAEDLAAEARWRRAVVHGLAGHHLVAAEALAEAEARIDRAEHPRSFLLARHHRIWHLDTAGQTEEAGELFDASAGLYRSFQEEVWFPMHRTWLEARLCHRSGLLDEAQALYGEIWTVAFTGGEPRDLVLISLDLSKTYIPQGRHLPAWQLTTRLIPLLQSWGVHRRILHAWALLRHGFGTQTATVGLVEEIQSFMTRGWRNPEMPFR